MCTYDARARVCLCVCIVCVFVGVYVRDVYIMCVYISDACGHDICPWTCGPHAAPETRMYACVHRGVTRVLSNQ